jgi:predicted O-methyltransferase YrrM
MTTAAFERVLDGYRRRMAEEAVREKTIDPSNMGAHRDEFLLPVGEDVANLMVDMIVGLKAKVIVELGTSYGFSTLFLAEAARRTGGLVYTYDLHAEKQAYARARIAEAGLASQVEWRLGDAVAQLAQQPTGVDFALLDIWKDMYIPCLHALLPKLAVDGVIVADNMLQPERSRPPAAAYRAAVRAIPGLQSVLLPIGQGIDVTCKVALP